MEEVEEVEVPMVVHPHSVVEAVEAADIMVVWEVPVI